MKNKNQKDTLPLKYVDIVYDEIVITDTPSNNTTSLKQTWNKFPKSLFGILLLEVITVYALLFFVSPTQVTLAVPNESEAIKVSDTLIALTNQERDKYNLNHLEFNAELYKAAEAKAEYIFTNNNFSHERLNGETFSSWIKETDYQYKRVGENLAIHFKKSEDIMSAWMTSPLHRKNILNPLYEDVGIAVVDGLYNNKPTTVVVQIFGTSK